MPLLTLELASVAFGLAAASLALGWESRRVYCLRKAVALRIAVTGSRGKSTLVRLITAALRQADYNVVAKTTGTEPRLHHVDGQEERIIRRGYPSVLEVKKSLFLAKKEQAQALVVELMSLLPENLFVESVRLLQPHFLLITNIREDHLEQMGEKRFQIAQTLAAAIPPGGKIILPAEELYPIFEQVARQRGAEIIRVDCRWPDQSYQIKPDSLPVGIFPQHLALLSALLKELGIAEKFDRDFFGFYRPDPGAPQIFRFTYGPSQAEWFCLNAFAANDPLSTREILNKLKKQLFREKGRFIGLLNLRADRGDRTWQWVKALQEGLFSDLEEFFVIGGGARAFSRKFREDFGVKVTPLPLKKPNLIMDNLLQAYPRGGYLVGLGNIGGLGRDLVNWWINQARVKDKDSS